MRKLKLLFACLLMAVLSIGQMWATEKTWTWNSVANLGSANSVTTSPAGEKTLAGTVDGVATNKTWTLAMTSKTTKYYLNSGQFGSNSNACSAVSLTTSAFTEEIKYVKVHASSGGTATITVTVGGTTYVNGASLTSSDAEYKNSTAGSSTGNIVISFSQPSTSKNMKIYSIDVVYDDGESDVAVTEVTLNKTSTSIEATKTETLTATVAPNNATNKSVTWSSSDETVATVTNGVVSAKKVGTATITCTSVADNTKTATCEITVTAHTVTPGTYDIDLNAEFYGTTSGANISTASVTASQDDITAVTGATSGTKPYTGTDAIRYYANNYLTLSVPSGYNITAVAFAEPSSGTTWNGSITVNTGTYTNDTKSWEGKANSVTFSFAQQNRIATATVTYAAAAPELTVDPEALDFGIVELNDEVAGKTFTLTGSDLTDANAVNIAAPAGYTVSPKSVTPSSGAINQTITVTPVTTTAGDFNSNITISTDDLDDAVTVALTMTVSAPIAVTGVELNKTATSIEIDCTETLTATVSPNDATNKNVTWSSSDETVATVADGVVTAKKVGTATITCASAADNTKTATCAVTVTPHVVKPGTYDITPNTTFWGCSDINKNNATENEINYTGNQNDITITIKNGKKQNAFINSTQTRVYSEGYTMAFSVPSGYNITAIVFTADGSNWAGTHTASVGTMTDSKHWSGKANSVTITFGGTCRINGISVTYEAVAPEVTVDPSSLSFTAKQNIAVEGKKFTLTGANLTSGLALAASTGFSVNPIEITAADAMAQGGVEVTVTPATPTTTTTPVNGTVTISGGGLASNVVVNLSMAVTPTYQVGVAVNSNTMGSATINGGTASVYVTDDEEITLVANPENGYDFVNWTVSDENIVLDNENAASTTALAGAAGTITANFEEIAYSITSVSANNENYGTVSLSGMIITANPAEGYRYATPAYTVTPEGKATVVQDGNSFTVSNLTDNCSIIINFELIPTYTVTWNVNGQKVHEQTAVAGTALTGIPSVTPSGRCAELTFLGWKVGAIDGTVTDAPEMIDLNEIKMPNGGANYYAVFGAGGGEHSVTITNSDFTGKLDGSYSTVTIKKTIGETEYSFEVNACKQSNMCQMRDNSTLSYIAIPALPGVIKEISTSECANGSGDPYAGTLRFKSSKSRGNSNTGDIVASTLESAKSFTLDLSANTTHNKGWLVTSAGLRIKDLTIIYNSTNYTSYMTTCPSCTEVTFVKAGEGNGNSFELQVNSAAVESVETCDAVEVTLDPALAQNYVLTNVEVSGVTGVTYDNYVISIPKGANGELTVTASFVENIPVTAVSLNKENTSIEVGNTETLTATIDPSTASIKTITWTSSNTNVATVDANGVVTAVAAGEATITATSDADENIKATCAITVTPHVVTPGSYDITLNNVLFGTTAEVNITEEVSAVVNDITLRVNGTGQTKPRTDAGLVRFYSSSSLTMSVPSGYVIKQIVYTYGSNESANKTAPSSGEVGEVNSITQTWTGKAQEVVFSFNGKSFISSISVTYAADVKYAVTFESPEQGGTLVIKDGEDAITSGATFDEGKTLDVIVTVDEANHYIGGAISVSDGENDITAEVLEGTTLTVPEHNIIVSTSFTPTYAISTVADGGSIALSYTAGGAAEGYAIAGTEITATATADGLHKFSSIALSDNVEVKSISNNVATFTMPEGAVTVTATFDVKEDASVNIKDDVNALDFGSVAQGSTPVAKTFKISGLNLEEGQLVIASNSENSKFTIDPANIDVNGTLNETTITVTPATGTAGVYEETLSITGAGLKQADEVHITLSLTVLNTYTATWIVNGNTESPLKTQTAVAGADLEFPANPTPSGDCKNLAFVGWLTSTLDEASESAPQGLITDATGLTMPENGITYYAVFAEKEGEDVAAGYSLSTTAPAAGDQVIIARLVSGTYYGLTTASNPSTSALTVSDGLVSEPANVIWDVESATSGVYLRPTGALTGLHMNSSALKVANDNNNGDIKFSANGNGSFKGTRADDARWIVTSSTNGLTCSATQANAAELYIFKYSAGSQATYSNYVTSCVLCNKVTLAKVGEDSNNTFALQVNDVDVTSVKTCSGDVAVNIVANPAIGNSASFAISGVEDASISGNVITIKEGAAGALTVTATFSQINYNVTMAQEGGAGATISGNQENKHYGEEITVTAEAVEGYGFTGWTIAPEVTFVENYDASMATTKFNMPNANVTATANYALIANCRISFQVNGAEVAFAEQTQAQEYTITEVGANVPSFTWVGWSETEYADEVEVLPATISTYTPEAGEATKVLYGIYKRVDSSDPNAGNYEKVTSALEDYSGDYLIVYETGSKVWKGSATSDGNNAIEVTIANNAIQANATTNAEKFVIASMTGGYSIQGTSGKYIAHKTANNEVENGTTYNTDPKANAISIDGDGNAVISSSTAILRHNTSNANLFRYYKSASAGQQHAIQLYKLNNTVTKYTSSPVEKVTVTFALDGGQGGCNTAIINKGTQLMICETAPTKTHSEFAGWKNGDDVYEAGVAYTFNTNITLTAQWKPAATYTVTFDKNGGTGTAETIEGQYAGDVITLPAALAKDDFDFKGWRYNGKNYKAGASFTMPANAVQFVAQWKKQNLEKLTLVTNASQLVAGSKVVFANQTASAVAGASPEETSSYMASIAATFNEDKSLITAIGTGIKMTLVQVADGWAFEYNGKYLAPYSNNKMGWKTTTTAWTIVVDENNNAKIENGENYAMRYNKTSGQERFAAYGKESCEPIQLYSENVAVSTTGTTNVSDLGNMDDEIIVASGEGVILKVDVAPDSVSYVAKNGATIQISAENEATKSVIADEKSKIEVTALTTVNQTFSVAATMGGGVSGQIAGSNLVTIAQSTDAYFDITLGADANPAQWHAIAVPFPVDVINGIYDAVTGKKLENEKNYAIMEYHGNLRAQGLYGWKKIRTTLMPGVFYLMTVDGYTQTFRFKMSGTVLPKGDDLMLSLHEYAVSTGIDGTNGGWNGVANPTLEHGQVGARVQVLNPATYTFEPFSPNSCNFVVGTPFFYQARSDSSMTMVAASGDVYYAPRRANAMNYEDILIRFGNNKYKDRFYISASEDATNEYEIGKDLLKMTMTNTPSVPQIFGNAYGNKLCMVNAPMVDDKAEYSLTLYAPKAGEYTISAPAMENADLYLTYNGSIIWNLSTSEYTNDFEKGNNEGYGLLLVKKIPGMATGCESIEVQKTGVQKIVIDDKVFILRAGQMYDVTGKMVK